MFNKIRWNIAQKGEYAFHLKSEWRNTTEFMDQTRYLFHLWGYKEDSFIGKTIIDVGAGSKLRSKFFQQACIIAIEPLASKFIKSIEWCDLKDAFKVYSIPAEKYLPELENCGDFAMCINVLDHCQHTRAVLLNVYKYLKPNSEFCLSVDIHDKSDRLHPIHLSEENLEKTVSEIGFHIISKFEGLGEQSPCYGHGKAVTFILKKGIS